MIKSKVVRIDKETWEFLISQKKGREKIVRILRRLLLGKKDVKYVLPSDLFETVEEARGASLMKNLKLKKKKVDEPIKVVVNG